MVTRTTAAILVSAALVSCATPRLNDSNHESVVGATTPSVPVRPTPPASLVPSAPSRPTEPAWLAVGSSLPSAAAVYYPVAVPPRFGAPIVDETDGATADEPGYTVVYRAPAATLAFIRGIGAGALGNLPAAPPTYSETLMVNNAAASLTVIPSESPPSQVIDVSWSDGPTPYAIRCFGNGCTVDDMRLIVQNLRRLTPEMLLPP